MTSTTMTIGAPKLAADTSLPKQARIILAHLEAGKTISQHKSMLVYHITRLSDCIFKIRNAGYDVEMEMKRDEVGGKYASYYLIPTIGGSYRGAY